MRFCDFFISYKIGLKGIKNSIPFTQLPLYRKIAIILIFVVALSEMLLLFFNQSTLSIILLILALLFLSIFIFIDSKKGNLEHMLQKHYVPYSVERINITLENLQKYGIDYFDVDTIDLLIAEAQIAQLHCDFFLQLKKPLQILGALIVPVVAYVAQKIGDAATQNTMIMMAINVIIISIIIFSLLYAIIPIIKNLFYRDYNKYNDLIYDLRQIKIFYTHKRTCFQCSSTSL